MTSARDALERLREGNRRFASNIGSRETLRAHSRPAGLPKEQRKTLRAWAGIPRKTRRAVSGLSAQELKWRGGSEGWSIREQVHHLVEANLVASNIVLAILGRPGCKYDWSWVIPDERWMKGLGYDRAPLEPALELMEALCAHVAAIVGRAPGSMTQHVRLLDSPGAKLRRRTLEQVLNDQCEHVQHHLREIAETRKAYQPAHIRESLASLRETRDDPGLRRTGMRRRRRNGKPSQKARQ